MGAPRLANAEEHFAIDGPRTDMRLFLRRLGGSSGDAKRVVLYLHGATFPSALSIAHRFDGRSWRDALCESSFNVWGLDFYGFGQSDRYPEMTQPAEANPPLCLAADAAEQVAAAVRFILNHEQRNALSLITHSWGSMPAGLFAGAHPALLDRWVAFAPLACRQSSRYTPKPDGPAWRLISVEDQWNRFVEDVPAGEPPVLSRTQFDAWAEGYLATDIDSHSRSPATVKTPSGPFVEILRAWHGELAWNPSVVTAPVAIVRGAWDGLVTDDDARWLFDALCRSTNKRDIKISRGTHLLHLETMRLALWRESIAFLQGEDQADVPQRHALATPRGHQQMNGEGEQSMKDAKPGDIAGYNPGSADVAKSPISMDELKELQISTFFSDEDVVYLRLSYDVLKDQAEDLVKVWRGIIALHPHLSGYSKDPATGEPDKEYSARVGKRFAQWVLDTAKAEYDQTWLDYQYEIGLRHHRLKKNQTDNAHTAVHIRGRDLLAFSAATVAPMRPYLERGGHSREIVDRMYDAWWKSMILQATLWSQPYMNRGDF